MSKRTVIECQMSEVKMGLRGTRPVIEQPRKFSPSTNSRGAGGSKYNEQKFSQTRLAAPRCQGTARRGPAESSWRESSGETGAVMIRKAIGCNYTSLGDLNP